MRKAGILMPVASLPSNYGIGEFGKSSYQFIDYLKRIGIKVWQILPLNPLGYGNSPYQPYSSFAGDELYISLDELVKQDMILKPKNFQKDNKLIDYEAVRRYKNKYLKEAFEIFQPTDEYFDFIKQEWVYEYAVFITLKKANNLICWNEWPKQQREWINKKEYDLEPYQSSIRFELFLQYEFYTQWMKVKEYANQNGIQIMGDLPFYVGIDSLDVWANRESFLIDKEGVPVFIAGVPPDYFSETGQRWGNPIYDWEYLKKHHYKFWIERLEYCSKLFDITRIDHFRAFDTYWKIPASCPTAVEGEWIEAPGYEVFDTLLGEMPDINIVVEDLGDLRKEVGELRDHYEFMGMKVVQFTFDPKENNNDFPDRKNMIIYSGTHDNQTIKDWFDAQDKVTGRKTVNILKKQGYSYRGISHKFIAYTLDNIADLAVIPMADVIKLGKEGRINTPGTLGSPNWEWRMPDYRSALRSSKIITELVKKSNR